MQKGISCDKSGMDQGPPHGSTSSIPGKRKTNQFPRAEFMMWKSSVLWWKPVSFSDPGPEPKAHKGVAVWVWLAQATR